MLVEESYKHDSLPVMMAGRTRARYSSSQFYRSLKGVSNFLHREEISIVGDSMVVSTEKSRGRKHSMSFLDKEGQRPTPMMLDS